MYTMTYFLKSVISLQAVTDKCGKVRGVESCRRGWHALSHNSNMNSNLPFFNWCGLEKTRPWLVLMQSHYTTCFSFIMCNAYLAWINLEMSVPPNTSSDMLSSLMALQCKRAMLYCWGLIWTIKSPWHNHYGKSLQPGQFGVQTMVSARDFLFSTPIQTSSWAPPASCTMGTSALFQG